MIARPRGAAQPSGATVSVTRSPANQVTPYSTGAPSASTLTATGRRIGAPAAMRSRAASAGRAAWALIRVAARV